MKSKKFISVLMCLILAFSCFSLTACESCNDDGGDTSDEPTYESTGEVLVDGGIANYKILMPENYYDNEYLRFTSEELVYGFKEACGCDIEVTTEYVEGNRYISVGETELFNKNKSTVCPEPVKKLQSRVVVYGKDVYLFAKLKEFHIYAAYDFMNKEFGWKVYTCDDVYVKRTDKLELLDLNLTDEADFEYRGYGSLKYWLRDNNWHNYYQLSHFCRMKLSNYTSNLFVGGHSLVGTLLPKTLYYDKHPEWYSTKTPSMSFDEIGQICLTNDEVVDEMVERCKYFITTDPEYDNKDALSLGMDDNYDQCLCANCQRERNRLNGGQGGDKNAPNTGLMISFLNKVVRKLNAWMAEYDPDKEMVYTFYAYYQNVNPPVKEVNGEYVPICDDVIPEDNLCCEYAPLKNDLTQAYTSEKNTSTYKSLMGWQSVMKLMHVFYYNVNYGDLLVPYNTLVSVPEAIKDCAKSGYWGFYLGDGTSTIEQPHMGDLKVYLFSQLLWDSTRPVDEVAYEFIDYYYGPVAEQFKKYYQSVYSWQLYQTEYLAPLPVSQDASLKNEKFWNRYVLGNWVNMIDDMIKELEPLKHTDPDSYQKYFDRVNIEKVWHYYLLGMNYKKYFNKTQIQEMIDFLRKYCPEYNCAYVSGNTTIDSVISSWI